MERDQDHQNRIIAAARAWLGTPYVHQASAKGGGCDCLGLIRGVWREVFAAPEPEAPPPYTPDWAEVSGEETLFHAAQRHLDRVPLDAFEPGDVVLFRMAPGAPMKHAAILTAPDRIIHAYWGRAVVEGAFIPWWRRKLAAAFAFPHPNSGE